MTKDGKQTVMIIDENWGIRELYRLELADRGYGVVTAGDAAAAEGAVSRSKPDLIVFDPWMDGRYRWDLLMRVRGRNPSIPVLVCLAFGTALPDWPARLADCFIVKSSSTRDLLQKVGDILETGKPAGDEKP